MTAIFRYFPHGKIARMVEIPAISGSFLLSFDLIGSFLSRFEGRVLRRVTAAAAKAEEKAAARKTEQRAAVSKAEERVTD